MEFSLKRKHFAEEGSAFLPAVWLCSKLTVEYACRGRVPGNVVHSALYSSTEKKNTNRGATE
ncbi:hypothetical protein BDZ91DRAFT_718966 [Kalaharituber pfeilii]|nr:hypothetical protein BDZ91DRAFT_718966 [Kalaharituber pfeilii]